MITIKCDRCGVYYDIYNVKRDRENTNGIMFLNIDENGVIGLGKPIDLCPECMEDVRNFVQGVEKNEIIKERRKISDKDFPRISSR